jgi:hypothetical protein
MEYFIGAGLALAVAVFATFTGLDRDRSFYPTVLVVVASYYDLFAVMAGDVPALGAETLVLAFFLVLSIVGFRTSLWVIVAALVAHGLFDFFRGGVIANPGVPAWWPTFCLSFDLIAAVCLADRLVHGRGVLKPTAGA